MLLLIGAVTQRLYMRWYIIIRDRNKCFWCVGEKAYALLCTKQRPKWRWKKYTRHKHNNITPGGINNLQQCRKKCGGNAHKVNIEAKWKLLIGAKCETLLCIENCTMHSIRWVPSRALFNVKKCDVDDARNFVVVVVVFACFYGVLQREGKNLGKAFFITLRKKLR